MQLTVDVDLSGAMAKLDLANREIRTAAARALNRTAEQGRTAAVRDITGAFNLQASFVRERIEVVKVSSRSSQLVATLVVRGKHRSLNLIRFVERRVTLAEHRRRKSTGTLGVYARVRKDGKNALLKGAFIGNQGRTVFKRIGASRLPIEPLQAIGVGQAMISDVGREKLEEAVRDRFGPNLRHELSRAAERLKR